MLGQAIAVVEAARRLSPSAVPGIPGVYRLGCQPRDVPAILRELAGTIEAYDAAGAIRQDPYSALKRAIDFAVGEGIDRGAMITAMRGASPEQGHETDVEDETEADELPQGRANLDPGPGDIGPADPTVLDPVQARSPDRGTAKIDGVVTKSEIIVGMVPAPKLDGAPAETLSAPAPRPNSSGLMQGASSGSASVLVDDHRAMMEADDQISDLEGVVDSISDRLEYIANRRGGSSPRVRVMMAALRNARIALASLRETNIDNVAMEMDRLASEMADIDEDLLEMEREFAPRPGY